MASATDRGAFPTPAGRLFGFRCRQAAMPPSAAYKFIARRAIPQPFPLWWLAPPPLPRWEACHWILSRLTTPYSTAITDSLDSQVAGVTPVPLPPLFEGGTMGLYEICVCVTSATWRKARAPFPRKGAINCGASRHHNPRAKGPSNLRPLRP